MSALRQKILLLLFSGLAIGFTYNPRRQWSVVKSAAREWRRINNGELHQQINRLYRSKLIRREKNKDGTYTLILTDKGKLRALTYNFEAIRQDKKSWDGKWRLVFFDVPEKTRQGRDILRDKLKRAGFRELQKSVFVFPYDCKNEIDYIIENFDLRKYVRFAVLNSIDNELHLKSLFGLS